ncbi:MAG: hypothetical protein GF334_08985 [Candidatus Altiarchaeales archaeon]|nr:hypothetical protein [Candidatus Altiarchaeales archaeon]
MIMSIKYHRYQYHYRHIPTGKEGVSHSYFIGHGVLKKKVSDWNRSMPGTWQYWESYADEAVNLVAGLVRLPELTVGWHSVGYVFNDLI